MPILRGGEEQRGKGQKGGGKGQKGGGEGQKGGRVGTFLKLVKLLVEKFQKNTPKRYQDLAIGGCSLNYDILYLHCCEC